MKLQILSQREAVVFKPNAQGNTVIIRIHEPYESVIPLKHESLFGDELYVFFHDVHRNVETDSDDIKAMSLLDAKRILDFAVRHREADTLVIHCHAGISRSSAVALGVSWILNLANEEERIWNDPYCHPNLHILETFMKILNLHKQKKPYMEEMKKRLTEGMKAEPFSW